VDGKSILGLLLLAAARGREIEIAAEGSDEREALEALADLVARGFEDAASV
jgi:phosphocarrier protein